MFNIGSGEIALIAVVALLILGPKRLPELARGIGKFVREFRKQTDEVRGVVEREFYKMDQEVSLAPPEAPLLPQPAQDSVANGNDPLGHDAMHGLPGHEGLGQLGSGMPQGEPVLPAATGEAAGAPVSPEMASVSLAASQPPSEPSSSGSRPSPEPSSSGSRPSPEPSSSGSRPSPEPSSAGSSPTEPSAGSRPSTEPLES